MIAAYPVTLRELLSKNAENILLSVQNIVSWQLIASYRNDQESLDHEMESKVKEQLFYSAIKKKITVFQDQTNVQGRVYFAELVAMTRTELEQLLYEAYRRGISEMSNRNFNNI